MNKSVHITILVDNTTIEPSLSAEHGLSMWIEAGGKYILWDTGQSEKFFDNAKQLGIDIGTADAIALSHGHHDHTGGLARATALAPNAAIYLHPAAAQAKYSFKTGQSRPIGMNPQARLAVIEKEITTGVIYVNQKTDLAPGLTLTGPVPRHTPFENTGGQFYTDPDGVCVDELTDDQSLYIQCPEGIVVILGCAHSGVVNILDAVAEETNSSTLYAVIGGMHLVNADACRIAQTIAAFKRYDIQKIAPLHCTGSAAVQRLKETFGHRCLSLGTGSHLCF
jgi:7,8-dihydropterin-6-yl-methyl-4-(beta-D-ribofuranosyl)aminobenzene 5'-phosphate synthase